jgi:hypothetical protein
MQLIKPLHRLNMEFDLQSLFGRHVQSCTHWMMRPRNPPPRIWARIRGRYWSAKIEDRSLRPPESLRTNRQYAEVKSHLSVVNRTFLFMFSIVHINPEILIFARFDGTKGWLWSDTSCGLKLNYICQHSEFFMFILLDIYVIY